MNRYIQFAITLSGQRFVMINMQKSSLDILNLYWDSLPCRGGSIFLCRSTGNATHALLYGSTHPLTGRMHAEVSRVVALGGRPAFRCERPVATNLKGDK